WANFYNACFLLIFLFFGRSFINLMPFSVLAAVLIFTGYKLCKPSIWQHIAHVGSEQLLVFAATVLVTVTTDLLWGIFFGIAFKLLVNIWMVWSVAAAVPVNGNGRISRLKLATDLFRNPVGRRERVGDALHVYFDKP